MNLLEFEQLIYYIEAAAVFAVLVYLVWNTHLMCKVGIHKWSYFRMANSFIAAFPEIMSINRRCKHCGIVQCTEDGDTWQSRL